MQEAFVRILAHLVVMMLSVMCMTAITVVRMEYDLSNPDHR